MKKKSRGIESLKKRYGMFFTAHWAFGLIVFFLVPLISSLAFSFSNVTIVPGGTELNFVGFKHFRYLLTEEAQFVNNLRDDMLKMLLGNSNNTRGSNIDPQIIQSLLTTQMTASF